ncbi:acidic mammalian chitinase-like [Anoplophora glabripennis]|uniref:acidic mammalian chitinase-like n=1 Tax=Anoplophora glabripennis TaxID=217634 RepID=UPI00087522F5|nr:acidic mammalian chitinase-like [Anoplophora glabripennis]
MKVSTVFLLVATSIVLLSTSASAKNIICYFASWTVYRPGNGKFDIEDIDTSLCTHIMFGFIGITTEGRISILDGWESNDDGLRGFSRLVDLTKVNPNLKVLVSMGGWNEGSEKYSIVAADPAKRKVLIDEVIQFLGEHNFHGFDLDWEYPALRNGSDIDPANYVELLKELKAALSPKGYLLSAAVSGGVANADIAYDIPVVSELLDLINVMVYDFHGAFESFVGHTSPLSASSKDDAGNATLNVKAGIQHWIDKGADPAKMHLGVGTYGRSFTLADPNNAELYAPVLGGGIAGPYTRQEGVLGYNEICELHSDWTYIWDDEQQVPHRVSGDQWVGYDDEKSIALKVEYANEKELGGIMVWSFDNDDFRGICGSETYPLMRTIKRTLK